MSVCDGSDNMDNEDLEVKQEPMDSDIVKSEDSLPGLEPKDARSNSQAVLVDSQLQKVRESGTSKL